MIARQATVPRCDNASVGVIILDHSGNCLMLTRARPPAGVAPVAGHIDDHGGPLEAARAEVAEEVGLTVVSLTPLAGGWRNNVCRRPTSQVGHQWTVYRAVVTGHLRPSQEETRGATWYTPREVAPLATRTAAYAHGCIPEAKWQKQPGLEPVWCRWLVDVGLIGMSSTDLAAIEQIATR